MPPPVSPDDDHPLEAVDRLAAGRASSGEIQRAVQHLLARCPICAERLSQTLRAITAPPPAEELDAAVDRALERVKAGLARD